MTIMNLTPASPVKLKKNRMPAPGRLIWILAGFFCLQASALAQNEALRPGLFFREDWKETPAEIPLHQGHVSHPNLIVTLHGPGQDSLKKSHHDTPADDPFYVWSGLCPGTWAVSLRHKEHSMNLSAASKIRWRSKQSGFRKLHVILRLEDGSWLVSRQSDGPSGDWRVKEFNVTDLEWYGLDMEAITEKRRVNKPDLSKVVEVGFTDLMPGGQSDACSRLDWIEVYAYLVRPKQAKTTH